METKVERGGSSLALHIPESLAREMGLVENSPVELSLIDGKLVIAPVGRAVLRLEQLLAQVTESNLHSEGDS